MRLPILASLLLLSCGLPSTALAGRIFGDIKLDGKPVPAGVMVTITRLVTVDGKSKPAPSGADTTKTDQYGAYKLMVKDPGKCVLSVALEKQTHTLEVFSYKEATRYDLILEKKDGKVILRRK